MPTKGKPVIMGSGIGGVALCVSFASLAAAIGFIAVLAFQ